MDPILAIILILVVAKGLGEIVERVGYPPMIGEIVAGILLGPSILNLVILDPTLEAFAAAGVIALLFISGAEMNPKAFARARDVSVLTGAAGVAVPLFSGIGVGYLLGLNLLEAIFLGIILSITSIGVAVRTLIDLKKLNTLVGSTIVGAAVIDDILGIVLLGLLSSIALGEAAGMAALALPIALSAFFLLFAFTVGKRLVTWAFLRSRRMRTHEMPYTAAIIIAFAAAYATEAIGLHYAIGAFIAGLMLGDQIRKDQGLFDGLVDFAFGFFVTFFFVSIGLLVRIEPETILSPLLVPLIAVALAGKTAGGFLGSLPYLKDRMQALIVGFGLTSRGELALVVAQTSLAAGIISVGLFSVVTLMVIATVFLAPILVKWGFSRMEATRSLTPAETE
ncbi:MAG: cation:proton antiporter [Methanomicrobiaceae archaeon]|uniref:Na+/h+ antiporter n=1 Tax=hydrocarbon metagenome TaxID=938273 RepID=A0A0W8FFP7_9ZZZZ|nr:cation:proton antiporter [Methanomicrobiaceae archaeon]MDD5420401.1 cation:proton antiporter [Methanomicrobiaceae archaeon]